MRRVRARSKPTHGDAAHLVFGVDHRVEAAARRALDAARLAEVEIAEQLADDDHVGAADDLGTQGRGVEQSLACLDRAQIGVDAERFAKPEKTFFGPLVGGEHVPLGAADRAEEHRVGAQASLAGLGGEEGRRVDRWRRLPCPSRRLRSCVPARA